MDGKNYELVVNNGANHLHGGSLGFDKQIWNSQIIQSNSSSGNSSKSGGNIDNIVNTQEEEKEFVGVEMQYTSVDNEEGYPGNLQVCMNNCIEYIWLYMLLK